MQSLLAEIQVLKEKNEILQDLHTHSTSQYKSLMIKYEDQSSKHKMKEEQFRLQHETEIDGLMCLLEIAKVQNHDLRQQNESLLQTVSDYETKHRSLEHKCDRKQQEVNQLRCKLDAMQSDIIELKSKLYDISTVNNLQNQLIDDLQEKINISATRKYSISPCSTAIANNQRRTLRILCDERHRTISPSMKRSVCSKSVPFCSASLQSESGIDCVIVNTGTFLYGSDAVLTSSDAVNAAAAAIVYNKQKSTVSVHSTTPSFQKHRYRHKQDLNEQFKRPSSIHLKRSETSISVDIMASEQ
mmetsp:Transcript_74621/g.118774  ORF Transcript_74621/g.118774 Transcript_74621/m.118774 type:complete len:300 (-) Transcript_74621:185-1084(-)